MKIISLQFSNQQREYEFQGNVICDDVTFTRTRGAYQQKVEFIKDGGIFLILSCDKYDFKNILDNEYELRLIKE